MFSGGIPKCHEMGLKKDFKKAELLEFCYFLILWIISGITLVFSHLLNYYYYLILIFQNSMFFQYTLYFRFLTAGFQFHLCVK